LLYLWQVKAKKNRMVVLRGIIKLNH